ncbi:hypothetical protein GUITHDRAFT_151636, partial [Guillardia theta CCMP2712]
MGDLWLPGLSTHTWNGLVLDFTMTHPYNSSGSPVGLSALSGPAQQKISDHRASYGTHHPPKAFLPFTAGTLRRRCMGTLAFIVCVLACFGSIALVWVLPSSSQGPCATALCP